ncbi:hypothetical protein [Sphingomonas sp.]|uniref:hypothetical protein n=1 Tax=Sphingomonas sp. TaxID=28214 RepID=UPI000DB497AC|nr:hypothetical protein [Sphingomonas sp.]PZU08502.1 MAG: hypothetical protein DI605_11025 [Sphingomonas sp.]
MLTNPAGVLGAITPAIIIALTLEANLPLTIALRLVAVEFATMTVAMMLVPIMMGWVSDRAFAVMAIVTAIGAQLAFLTGNISIIIPARAVLGLAEGALYGLAIAVLARTPRPDRAFGIVVFSNQIVSALLLASATGAHLRFPHFGIFALLLIFLLLTSACAGFLHKMEEEGQKRPPVVLGDILSMLPGLAGIFLLATGFGAIWPVVALTARARGIGDVDLGYVLSVAGLAGIAGAALAILLADRIGRVLPLVAGSASLALAFVGSVGGPFGIAVPAILFFWSFLVPYYLGSAAEADHSGRVVVLAGAMLPLGIAAGQIFAGLFVEGEAFGPLSSSAAAMTGCAILCMILLRRRAKPVRPLERTNG